MSYLREIMRRLHSRHDDPSGLSGPSDNASGETLRSDHLQGHLDSYRLNLLRCSPSMLQYERAWLEEHLATLELCRSQPDMARTAGGRSRVEAMLEESRQFQTLLEERMEATGVAAARHRGATVATDHAWELSDPAVLRQWGIDPEQRGGEG